MNKTDIRARAREVVDLDTTDVSDTLLDLYIEDGYNRTIELERQWPFFETSATFSTVAEQRNYVLADIGTEPLREISALVDITNAARRLTLISYDDAESVWLGGDSNSGRPVYFSTWGTNIQLWPTPVAVYSMNVRGYRKPTAWYDSLVTEVDADDRLHICIVYYVLSQLYQLQEDAELAMLYRNTWQESAAMARNDIMRSSSAGPLIMSAGHPIRPDNGPARDATGWFR